MKTFEETPVPNAHAARAAKRLKELETENARLKGRARGVVARKRGYPRSPPPKMMTAPVRRVVAGEMMERGLSGRHALAVVGISASALR